MDGSLDSGGTLRGSMNSEICRLGSFTTWPDNINDRPIALAKAGFYYSGTNGSTQVSCFSCGFSTSPLNSGETVQQIHCKLSPQCAFLNSRNENGSDQSVNLPLHSPDMSLSEAYEALKSITAPEGTISDHDGNGDEGRSRGGGSHDSNNLGPSTHRHTLSDSRSGSTDPRKRPDLAFLDRMRNEKQRSSTFFDWAQGAWQHPTELAAAGFFYTGSADRVQCAFCRGILRNWEPNDVPLEEHRKHFVDCSFVKGFVVETQLPTGQMEGTRKIEHSFLPIASEKPKHPKLRDEHLRYQTFNGWPSDIQQDPVLLAEAGFFYAGHADNVKCFFCDGGLRNWEPEDDPWEEHAKWFPRCAFVRMKKGSAFINEQCLAASRGEQAGVAFRIEPKEIHARMDTDMVKRVLELGYSAEIVQKAIEHRLRTSGDDFPDVRSLMEALLDLMDRVEHESMTQGGGSDTPILKAKHPDFDIKARRVDTFNDPTWPSGTLPSPTKLAEAGFFYSGYGDNVKCFFCDGGLRNWEPDDDPWMAHARWFPRCPYVRCVKGASFVTAVQSGIPMEGYRGLSEDMENADVLKAHCLGYSLEDIRTVWKEGDNLCVIAEKVVNRKNLKIEARNVVPSCILCMKKEVNLLLVSCSHQVCCVSCVKDRQTCPFCRKLIRAYERHPFIPNGSV